MSPAALLRVLIIEDNPADILIFKQMIERIGFKSELQEFSKGEDALTWIDSQPAQFPQLIILDLELPGMHGIDVLKALKQNPAVAEIPVIVNTTSSNHDHISKTYRFGATFFMQKLYDIKLLEEVIQHLKITGRIRTNP